MLVGADVQRRVAGNGGAAGVGPQHVHVVPLPVRRAVPRVGRLRAGRRPVAGRARLHRRRRRAPIRQDLSAHREYCPTAPLSHCSILLPLPCCHPRCSLGLTGIKM